MMVAAIAAVGLTLAIGSAGQLALGQAGFMAIGAYGTAYLMLDKGWNFLVALLASVLLALVLGMLVGYIALRLRGNYLAMATLAVGSGIYALLVLPSRLGGANGYSPIPFPTIFGHDFLMPSEQFYLVAAFLVIVLVLVRWLLLSRIGRELVAMRDDEVAARTVGVNVTARKVQVFAVASAIGGVAGAVNAPLQTAIDPMLFSTAVSLQLFVMVIIGGLGQHLRRGARCRFGDLVDSGRPRQRFRGADHARHRRGALHGVSARRHRRHRRPGPPVWAKRRRRRRIYCPQAPDDRRRRRDSGDRAARRSRSASGVWLRSTTSRSASGLAGYTASSAPTAPARRPCSTSSAGCSARPVARSWSPVKT